MPSIFNRAELLVTHDAEEFARCTAALSAAGIDHSTETQNMGHGTRRAGTVGAVGESAKYSVLYQVFVAKSDLDRARDVCAHA